MFPRMVLHNQVHGVRQEVASRIEYPRILHDTRISGSPVVPTRVLWVPVPWTLFV
jgi:hypothetical protein